ncbi:MAG TPA: Flp family type IVb pilin [Beijerinckiaceae bacterium]|jgi:Flp pilus assembly pilin Flp
MTRLARFLRDEAGATAVEYGFIMLLVSLGGVAGYVHFGKELRILYDGLANTVAGVADNASGR